MKPAMISTPVLQCWYLFIILRVKLHLRDEVTDKETSLFFRLSVVSVSLKGVHGGTKRDAL